MPPNPRLAADLQRLAKARERAIARAHPEAAATGEVIEPPPMAGVYDDVTPPKSLPSALYTALQPQTFAVEEGANEREGAIRKAIRPYVPEAIESRVAPAAADVVGGLGHIGKALAGVTTPVLAAQGAKEFATKLSEGDIAGASTAGMRGFGNAVLNLPESVGEAFTGGAQIADAVLDPRKSTLAAGRKAGEQTRREGGTAWALRLAGTALSAPVTELVGKAAEAVGATTAEHRGRTWRQQGSNPVSAFGYDVAEGLKRGDGFMTLADAVSKTQGYQPGSWQQKTLQLGGFAADALLPTDLLVGGIAKAGALGPVHARSLRKHGVPRGTAAAVALGNMLPDYIPRIGVQDLGESMRPHANKRFSDSIEQEIARRRDEDPTVTREEAVVRTFRDQGRALLGSDQLLHVTGVGTFSSRDVPRIKQEMAKLFEPFGGRAPEVGTPIDLPQVQKIMAALKIPLDELAGLTDGDGLVTPRLRERLVNNALQSLTIKPSENLKRYSPLHEALSSAVDRMLPEQVAEYVQGWLQAMPDAAIRDLEFVGPMDMLKRDMAKMPETAAKAVEQTMRDNPDMTPQEALMSLLSGEANRRMDNAERLASGTPEWHEKVDAKVKAEIEALKARNATRRKKLEGEIAKVAEDLKGPAAVHKKAIEKVAELQREYAEEAAGTRPPAKPSPEVKPETKEVHKAVGQYLWENRNNPARTKRSQVEKVLVARGMDRMEVRKALGAFEKSRDYNPRSGAVSSGRGDPWMERLAPNTRRTNKHVAHAAMVMDQLRGLDVDPERLTPLTREDRLKSIMHRVAFEFDRIRETKGQIDTYKQQIDDLKAQIEDLPTDAESAAAMRNIADDLEQLVKETTEPKTRAEMQGILTRLAGRPVGDIPIADIGKAFDEVRIERDAMENDAVQYATTIEKAFVKEAPQITPLPMTLDRAKAIITAFAQSRKDAGKALAEHFLNEGTKTVPYAEGALRMIVEERHAQRLAAAVENMGRKHGFDVADNPELFDAINVILSGRVPYTRERGKLTLKQPSPLYAMAASYIDRWGLSRAIGKLEAFPGGNGGHIPAEMLAELEDAMQRGAVPQMGMRRGDPLGNVLHAIGGFRTFYKEQLLLAPLTPMGTPRYLAPQILGGVFSMINELGVTGTARVWSGWLRHPQLLAAVASGHLDIPQFYGGKKRGENLAKEDVFGNVHTPMSLYKEVEAHNLDTGQIRVEAAEGLFRGVQAMVEGRMPWMRDVFKEMFGDHATTRSRTATVAHLLTNPRGVFRAWKNTLWKFAGGVDHAMRVSVYVDQRLQGKSADQAAAAARGALLDFGKMTKTERNVLSKVFLFYSFTRANFDSYLHAVVTDPSRVARQARFLRELPTVISGEEDTENMRDIDQGRIYLGMSGQTGPKGEKFAYQTAPMPITSFLGMLTNIAGTAQSLVNATQADPDVYGPRVDVVPQDAAGAFGDVVGAAGPEIQAAYEIGTGKTPGGYMVTETSADNEVPAWMIQLGHLGGADTFDALEADLVTKRPANPKRAWLGDDVTYTANNEYLWKNFQRALGLSSTLRDIDRTGSGLLPGVTATPLPTREEAIDNAARDAGRTAKETTKTLAKREKAQKGLVQGP